MEIRSSATANEIQVTTAGARGATGAAGVRGAESGGGASAAGAGGREDQVQLSTLGAAIESLQPGSDAREARVNALQQAVGGGSYQVDSQAVASSIVEDASSGK